MLGDFNLRIDTADTVSLKIDYLNDDDLIHGWDKSLYLFVAVMYLTMDDFVGLSTHREKRKLPILYVYLTFFSWEIEKAGPQK